MAPSANDLLRGSKSKEVPVSFKAGSIPGVPEDELNGRIFKTDQGIIKLAVSVGGVSVGSLNIPIDADLDVFTPR